MKREDGANMEGMEDLNKRTWCNRLEFINRTDKSSRSSAIRAFIYLWRTIRRGGARAVDRKESRPQITMAAKVTSQLSPFNSLTCSIDRRVLQVSPYADYRESLLPRKKEGSA